MVKVMAVYDRDPLYAKRLSEYINQKGSVPFRAMAFSSLERLIDYSGEQEIEILLVGEDSVQEVREVRAGLKMVLCGGEFVKEREEKSIYKYQSGDCIMREVMACYCAEPVDRELAYFGRKALILGVYSPVGRCGKTSFALTLGQVLSGSFPTLFLSLEEFSGLSGLLGEELPQNLSDVLYLYEQGELNGLKLRSMVGTRGGMDYLAPVKWGEDLSQTPAEDLAMMIGQIAGESGYERLVVDLGRACGGAAPLLDLCDVIYMPVREDPISVAKAAEFEDYLEFAQAQRVREKIKRLHLPPFAGGRGSREYFDQLLWGELGDYVRALVGGGNELERS